VRIDFFSCGLFFRFPNSIQYVKKKKVKIQDIIDFVTAADSELSDLSEDEDYDEIVSNSEPNQISDNDSSEDEEDDVSLINLANKTRHSQSSIKC